MIKKLTMPLKFNIAGKKLNFYRQVDIIFLCYVLRVTCYFHCTNLQYQIKTNILFAGQRDVIEMELDCF